ncbi:hypothetical protein SDC9_93654 [bioreactor metagenome]|uniref:Uncharacterized protein n=1 Tax=bioreactor metagenome TaxID=1076179 RepID=A0A645A1K7_9ZZZZ
MVQAPQMQFGAALFENIHIPRGIPGLVVAVELSARGAFSDSVEVGINPEIEIKPAIQQQSGKNIFPAGRSVIVVFVERMEHVYQFRVGKTAERNLPPAVFFLLATEAALTFEPAVAAAAAIAFFTRLGFVDHKFAAVKGVAVQAGHGGLRFRIVVHFDESEAPGATGVAIRRQTDAVDFTVCRKCCVEILLRRRKCHVSHVNIHFVVPFRGILSACCSASSSDKNWLAVGMTRRFARVSMEKAMQNPAGNPQWRNQDF